MDVADWLRALGLEQYHAVFLEHEITPAMLPRLSAGDLEKMGVVAVGHQHRLLEAIAGSELARASDYSARDDLRHTAAERRQLSVMFCDMADSTALSTRLDPEDLSTVIRDYQSRVAATVARFGGHVARYVGDGVLIYFGWPAAHENNAERAVGAALAVIAAVAEAPVQGETLRLRIGIATGLVVIGVPIGSGEARQQTAIGATPNLAARLQGFAGANSIAIDETTRRQLGGLFECRALGPLQLKGFPDPVAAFLVLGERTVESRFQALRGGALTPLVGRDAELALLREAWEHAQAGRGQAFVVAGEAGIGKSRLIAALEQGLEGGAPIRLHYYCSPDQTDTALYPLIAGLQREAGFARGDTDDERLDRLRLLLPSALPADIALIADLLSIPQHHRPPILDASPQARKEATFAAVIARMRRLSRDDSLLLILEDAHWADASTLELFEALIPALADGRALCILAMRNDSAPAQFGQAGIRRVNLSRLDRDHAQALARSLTPTTLAPELLERIVEQTDGIPLFVEELTKTMVEAVSVGAATDVVRAVPASLQASLMARLDRIPVAKDVAQVGAVLGREFPGGLIAAVAELPEATLQFGLHQLVEAGLATRDGTHRDATYVFKHALVRDTAYNMLLRSRRRELHARAAAALEHRSPELREQQPELLAHHYTQAGLVEQAIAYWAKAGRRSMARSAMVEAVAQLRRALALISELPAGRVRLRQELELQGTLGRALFASENWAGEAFEAYRRARELAEQLEDAEATVSVLGGVFPYHISRSQYHDAREIAQKLLDIAAHGDAPNGEIIAHRCMGACLHFTGDFDGALKHFDRVLSLYDPDRHRQLAVVSGWDFAIHAAFLSCIDLLILGHLDRAAVRFELGAKLSCDVGDKFSLAFALTWGGIFSLLMSDQENALRQLTEAVTLQTERHFEAWLGLSGLALGSVLVAQGDHAQGLALAQSGYAKHFATSPACESGKGLVMLTPFCLGQLAQAYEAAGAPVEARVHLDAAIDAAEHSGEGWFEPEVHRLKGEWLVRHAPGSAAEAEAAFARAIDRAAQQNARLWQLRASVSLARLYISLGHPVRARDTLTPVYEWFTEGLDTLDLRQAEALLASPTV
jgi:class 3 adenylate cyclase/tetratricopeptide (TPR) repeat protein